MAEDNGCFYRYAQTGCGPCDGEVKNRDEYGNAMCMFHIRILPDLENIGALMRTHNLTFNQARDANQQIKNFERLRQQRVI